MLLKGQNWTGLSLYTLQHDGSFAYSGLLELHHFFEFGNNVLWSQYL